MADDHKKAVEAHKDFLRARKIGVTRRKRRTTKEILEGKPIKGRMNINQRKMLLGKAGRLRKKSQEYA